jgi:riboflavin synthase
MFTGIIEAKGRILSLVANEFGVRLVVEAGENGQKPDGWPALPKRGDSVAVNGCCLTYNPAKGDEPGTLGFDVIRESLDKTSLGQLQVGAAVNLELALTPTSAIGGHFVQGHVDGTGSISQVNHTSEECVITIQAEAALMKYIVPKGSVTIDGISLTIAGLDVAASTFNVALIPTTLELTTLGQAKVGDVVNLEADMIAKTVVHCMSNFAGQTGQAGEVEQVGPALTNEIFKQAGFEKS